MSKLTWKSPKLTVRIITIAALLIALKVILSKFSIGSESLVKVSFGFVGTILVGYYLGPWLGGVAMVIYDLIANTIFATGGNFFIGFTFSAFLSGVLAGAFFYQQKISWQRVLIYEFIQSLVSNILLTTLWIHILYHAPLWSLLVVRVPKNLIMWPIETLIGVIVLNAIVKIEHTRPESYS